MGLPALVDRTYVRGYQSFRAVRVLVVDELSAEIGAVNAHHARRFLQWHWDDDGSFVFSGRLSPEDGAVVVAALEGAGRSVPEDDTPRPECSAQHHRPRCSAEHLPPIARTHTGRAGGPRSLVRSGGRRPLRRGRARRGQHPRRRRDARRRRRRALRARRGTGARSGDGPPAGLRHASLVVIVDDPDGSPERIGRRKRRVSAPLRRALHARDRGCRFPGCSETRVVQRHHIRHFAHGGSTSLDNLVELCWFHHRAVHEGGMNIELGVDATVTVTRADGTVLAASPPTIDVGDGGIEARNEAAGERITATTSIPAWYRRPARSRPHPLSPVPQSRRPVPRTSLPLNESRCSAEHLAGALGSCLASGRARFSDGRVEGGRATGPLSPEGEVAR